MLDAFLKNTRDNYIKKYFFDILGSRYFKNEKLIERILHFLTESDVKDLNAFVADIYETAYLKCIEDHKKILKDLGYKVNIVPDQSNQSNEGVISEGMQS